MKTQIVTIALSLATLSSFAQKKEVRNAGKAVESGEYEEAKTLLTSVESQIASEKDRVQEDFYLAQGKAYLGNPKSPTQSIEELKIAGEAFQKLLELDKNNQEALQGISDVKNAMVNSAVSSQNSQNYSEAASKLYQTFEMSPQDTLYLYYAASNAANGKDYDTALKYYEKLKDIGFTGKGTEYSAVNKETGEREIFNSKDQRDIYVKSGDYTDPGAEKLPSKRGEITKNIAMIYLEKEETEKAMEAIKDAKAENPDDTSLMLAEADIYFNMGNIEKYTSIVEKVIEKDPENADLYYNLGVGAMQMDAREKAVGYFEKAIKYNPEMLNAYLNLSSAILMEEQEIIDQMNELGTSEEDNKRYEKLSKNRKDMYRKAVPHIEVVVEKDPNNKDAVQTLINIYQQLGETEKANKLKSKL